MIRSVALAPCGPPAMSSSGGSSKRRHVVAAQLRSPWPSDGAASSKVGEAITSPSNPLVKHCVKLRQSSSYRHSCGSVLVVGLTPISEIMSFRASDGAASLAREFSPFIDCLFVLNGEELPGGLSNDSSRIVHVNVFVMKKLAGLKSIDSTEAVAVMKIPNSFCELGPVSGFGEVDWFRWLPCHPRRVLVLDGVQDPGNLGTLIRSAMAFKWDAIFLLPGCCDPFNEKALRAARGASFQFPVLSGNWSHLENLRDRFQMRMLAAHPVVKDLESIAAFTLSTELADALANKPLCLILGSEGQGISDQSRFHCELVTIPMAGQFESLNVSIAGGIFLYMLQNQTSNRNLAD